MTNPLTVLLWLSTHWWVFAILAALIIAGLVYSSVLPLAKVIGAFFKVCAAIAEFFTTPKEQIAPKVLCCIAFFCFGATPGFYYGKSVVKAQWAAADKRAEQERKDLDKSIDNQAAKDAEAAEKKIEELETRLNKKESDNATAHPDCTYSDADVGGVRNAR